jgi:vacuolar-type H+-ATPase subunit I/STV1
MSETTNPLFLGTYGGLTAESILAYSDIHLSREELEMQLRESHSFYAQLVKVPTQVVINSLLNTQCRDLQSYSQERLIEYILSGVEYKMTSEEDIKLKEKIEEKRLELISLGADLTQLESAHYEFMLSVYVLQERQAFEWNEALEQHAKKLESEIEQCKPDMPPEYKTRLLHYLKTQAATISLSEKDLKSLKIKFDPSAVEKAVIQLFIEANSKICPNVLETARNIESEVRNLQDELGQARDVLVSTVEKVKLALLEKNHQFSEMRETINTLLLDVDQNVNAFRPSEDTINNNLNMNNLKDLGLVAP